MPYTIKFQHTSLNQIFHLKGWSKVLFGILAFIVAGLVYWFLPDSCPEAARRCAFILVLAAGFWAFEIFPLYVTSLLVVLLLIFALAKPGGVMNMDRKGYTMFLVPFASPVIMLFFGGFMLAAAMHKYQADRWVAERILTRFGRHPYSIIVGLMVTTAVLSMWISNTAATAIMIGIIQPFIEKISPENPFRKGVILSIPFSANLGGMATPIGTPPNAIAIGFLSNEGIYLSFVDWMLIAIPLMIILLALASAILFFFYRPEEGFSTGFTVSEEKPTAKGKWVLAIVLGTILLFVTSPLHKIPESLIALLCAGVLTATGLLSREDVKRLDWDILLLMWGGLALGAGVKETGLGDWIVSQPLFEHRGLLLVVIFSILAMGLSLFISNTATAALLLPIALDIHGANKLFLAVTIALSCSVAMIFPVSTPPNAIAYSTGLIKNKDMVKAGAAIGFISLLIILVGYRVVIPFVCD